MNRLKRIAVVLFWAFVLLAMAGQLARAETVNMVEMPHAGDGAGGVKGIEWHWLVYVGVALICCFL